MTEGATHKRWWIPLVLVLITAAAHVPAVLVPLCGDDDYVLQNATSESWSRRLNVFDVDAAGTGYFAWYSGVEFQRVFVRLVPSVLISMQAALAGYDAVVFHLVTLALHVINALLIFWLVMRWRGDRLAAGLAAGAFAVYPASVEVVAAMAAQPLAVAACLGLLSTCCWVKFREGAGTWWLAGSLALATCCVYSYEAAAVFPVLVLLGDLVLFRGRASWPARAAMLSVTALFACVQWLVRQQVEHPEMLSDWTFVDAWQTLRVDAINYLARAALLFDPREMLGYWLHDRLGEPAAAGLMIGLVTLALWWARRRPVALLGLVAFAGLLALPLLTRATVSMMNMPTFRQLYLPSLGLAVVVAVVVQGAARRRLAAGVVTALLLVAALQCVLIGLYFPGMEIRRSLARQAEEQLIGVPRDKPIVVVGRVGCGYSLTFAAPGREVTPVIPLGPKRVVPELKVVDRFTLDAISPKGFPALATKARRLGRPSGAHRGTFGSGGFRGWRRPVELSQKGHQELALATVRRVDSGPRITHLRFRFRRPLKEYVFVAARGCRSIERLRLP